MPSLLHTVRQPAKAISSGAPRECLFYAESSVGPTKIRRAKNHNLHSSTDPDVYSLAPSLAVPHHQTSPWPCRATRPSHGRRAALTDLAMATALALSRPEACISTLAPGSRSWSNVPHKVPLSLATSKTMGLLSIIKKIKRREEMHIFMV
jgi:hypothetical protein